MAAPLAAADNDYIGARHIKIFTRDNLQLGAPLERVVCNVAVGIYKMPDRVGKDGKEWQRRLFILSILDNLQQFSNNLPTTFQHLQHHFRYFWRPKHVR